MLVHKISLKKLQRNRIIQSLFSDQNDIIFKELKKKRDI